MLDVDAHDRLEPLREDASWLAATMAAPDTRWFVLGDAGIGERRGLPVDVDADHLEAPVLLGRAGDDAPVAFAVDATRGRNPAMLEAVGRLRPDRVAVFGHDAPALLLHALAMARWHSRTRRCSQCGTPLVARRAGHVLWCEHEDLEHFPRLEPAMIVAVVDHDDRILLGRQEPWEPHWMSTLAGFVEPGETIEGACRREVLEESGVEVGEVSYVASQPWPFPASLMIGLRAEALTTDLVLEDEVVEARWFSRDELQAAFDTGEVAVPPPASIAHHLVRGWFGSEVVDWSMRR